MILVGFIQIKKQNYIGLRLKIYSYQLAFENGYVSMLLCGSNLF